MNGSAKRTERTESCAPLRGAASCCRGRSPPTPPRGPAAWSLCTAIYPHYTRFPTRFGVSLSDKLSWWLGNGHSELPQQFAQRGGRCGTSPGPTASCAKTKSRNPPLRARNVSGWPKRCKLAHAFLWEDSYRRLKLAQLLGQLSVFLTRPPRARAPPARSTGRP